MKQEQKYIHKFKAYVLPLDIMLEEVAIYSNGDIGIDAESLEKAIKEKNPNYFIDWYNECITHDDLDNDVYDKIMGIITSNDVYDKIMEIITCDWIQIDSHDVEIMQYINKKDIHKQELYSGDIIKWDDCSNGKYWRVAIIEMNPDIQFKIIKNTLHELSCDEGDIFKFGCFGYKNTEDHIEKIGNKFLNPEFIPKLSE